jgi:hypothetical protein
LSHGVDVEERHILQTKLNRLLSILSGCLDRVLPCLQKVIDCDQRQVAGWVFPTCGRFSIFIPRVDDIRNIEFFEEILFFTHLMLIVEVFQNAS